MGKWLAILRRPSDAILFLQILGVATVVPIVMRLKLETVARVLEPVERQRSSAEATTVSRIARYVDYAVRFGRPVVRPGCLTRGVTRYFFMRRAGLDVTLHFGMGLDRESFVGHCWLVRDGEPFLETSDPRPRFTSIFTIPRGESAR